jgi:hypothetical protein
MDHVQKTKNLPVKQSKPPTHSDTQSQGSQASSFVPNLTVQKSPIKAINNL